MSNGARYAKWRRWLGTIYDEVTLLVWSADTYRRVREIVQANSAVNVGHGFHQWLTRNYAHTTVMGIRRQLDRNPKSISLRNLLNEMRESPELLTRERHLSLYRDDMRILGHSAFDSIAGRKASQVPGARLKDDLRSLLKAASAHRKFANKRLAHYDRVAELKNPPTFRDLDRSVRKLEGLVKKYTLLLEAQTVLSLAPVPQYDWDEIFRKPWIPQGSASDT